MKISMLKNWVSMAALAATAATAVGCTVTTNDPTVGFYSVSWALDAGTGASACPAGATTIWLVVDGVSQESFDCATTGTIDTLDYDFGSHSLSLEVTDTSGATLYAASDEVTVGLSGDGIPVSFDFPTNDGYVTLDWNLQDSIGDLTCEDVFAVDVEVELYDTITQDTYTLPFPCSGYNGTSALLPVSDYDVTVFLVDDQGADIAQSETFASNIAYGNELVDLGVFTFQL